MLKFYRLAVSILAIGLLGGVPAEVRAATTFPKVRLIIEPAPQDLDYVREVIREFATNHTLEYIESTTRLPSADGAPDFLNVAIVKAGKFRAVITNAARLGVIYIFMYEPVDSVGFDEISNQLSEVLQSKWPQTQVYEGI